MWLYLLAAVAAPLLANALFEVPVPAGFPESGLEKHHILTAPQLRIDGNTYNISYQTILRGGQTARDSEMYGLGQLLDQNMQPIFVTDSNGNPNITRINNRTVVGEYLISQYPDYTSILQAGNRLFMFVHFESPQPAISYLVELNQDTNSCQLTAKSVTPVDWSQWGGLWNPCAGSVSPWGTHLGSEEGEPDARQLAEATNLTTLDSKYTQQMKYFGIYPNKTTLEGIRQYVKPYRYGHATEMIAKADGSYEVKKHYSMGRMAFELPLVMPDQKTVYLTDDGDNGMFGMFKADAPANLSCGTLYGARATQTSNVSGGAFNITWINMGRACDAELIAAQNMTFTDIFEAVKPSNGTCPAGFNSTNVMGQLGQECLKLKPGMALFASRFETRRYLAMLGGTTEWSKWEGITFAPELGRNGRLYTALSEVRAGMEDNMYQGKNNTKYDLGDTNDIRLQYNKCGCIYALDVDANYTATNMSYVLCGNTRNNTDEFNACDITSIASPDNLGYLQGHNAIIVGEDTEHHENDAVWLYDLNTKNLTRLMTTPYGSESTSVYYHPEINGCAYALSIVQHPYGESDQYRVNELGSTGKAGVIGYLGNIKLPAADMARMQALRANSTQPLTAYLG
jgi:secreted PhoX family phosphatase